MTDEAISKPKRQGLRPFDATLAREGNLKREAAKAAWGPVRQPSNAADIEYLKAILKDHGIGHIPEAEPATVRRLAKLIRRAGLTVTQAEEAVGLKLPKLIEKNPGHALWWLLATTLEANG